MKTLFPLNNRVINYDNSTSTLPWVFLLPVLLSNQKTVLGQSVHLAPKAIEVNGVTLHYVEEGEGTPVIFVHGSFGDYRTWHYQMEEFSKQHRTFSYSRRYYYPNDAPTDSTRYYSMLHINDLVAFIKALNVGPVHLAGHSAGGWIALVAAIYHPEIVKSLILGEPPVDELITKDSLGQTMMGKAVSEVFMPTIEAFRQDEDERTARLFADGVTGNAHFLEDLPPVDREIMSDNIETEKNGFLAQTVAPEQPYFTCADVQKITVPVLLVSGENTPQWLSHLTDRLETCLQHPERVTLPNTSHRLEFQNPQAFNKAVLHFIDTHGG